MLRPKKVNPVVGNNGVATGPVTITEYYDGPIPRNGAGIAGDRYVRAKKQLDATNWDETTTYMDSLGRAVKTVAEDSQGDVIVETHYDLLGRVDRVTNPYRAGDAIQLWNKTRYDAAGRVGRNLRSCAAVGRHCTVAEPESREPRHNRIWHFGRSKTGYVGTVVTTTDASGRKGRSVTNALGQLVRVDEPDSDGNLPALPQSTGNSTPEPSPTEPNCVDDCLFGGDPYSSQSTFYKYDAYGKMVQVTQGDQNRFFKYDSLGRLIRVRQPEQQVNSPGLDLPDSYNTSGQWTAGFTYDILGNVLTATDAKGTVIHNEYDRASRVTRRYYTGETGGQTTPQVNFVYDGIGSQQSPNWAKGKLTKVDNAISVTLYSQFDNFGRLKESSQITDGQTYISRYTYNLSGALVQETYPSGRIVKNEFEPDGDLEEGHQQKSRHSGFHSVCLGFFLYGGRENRAAKTWERPLGSGFV